MVVRVVVASSLRSADDAPAFVQLSREFHRWLEQQDGFLSYDLVGDGRHWADSIEWCDLASANAGNAAFSVTSLRQGFAHLVESYVAVVGSPVDTGRGDEL